MKLLIVGFGCVSSAFLSALKVDCEVDISVSSKKELIKVKFESVSVPLSRSGIGGLGHLWHSVLDLSELSPGEKEKSSLARHYLGGLVDNGTRENSEFVPFFPYRPHKRLRQRKSITFQPEVREITKIDKDLVEVRFASGNIGTYDFVFIGTGAHSPTDPLINSSLAADKKTLSDHLVFIPKDAGLVDFSADDLKLNFNSRGHLRKYKKLIISDEIEMKVSFRRSLKSDPSSMIVNKAIYIDSTATVIKRLVSRMDPDLILQSLNLRYGFPYPVRSGTAFSQVKVDDLYSLVNGSFELNRAVFDNFLFSVDQSGIEYYRDSFISAIHYFGRYDSVDKLISFNEFHEYSPISVVSPNYNFTVSSSHFTFKLMLIAEAIAGKLNEKYSIG
jgi:hypothetical protein